MAKWENSSENIFYLHALRDEILLPGGFHLRQNQPASSDVLTRVAGGSAAYKPLLSVVLNG